MDTDDLPVGRLLSRREIVRLFAIGSAGAVVGCRRGAEMADTAGLQVVSDSPAAASPLRPIPTCVVMPELTVGPYFVDKQLDRSDIRVEPTTGASRAGAPLALVFNVSQVGGGACSALAGAMVDVWQCDAQGEYSGFADQQVGFNTVGQKFLRGYQVTDANGIARFTTIYPGWYPGRTVHIHFKVRTPASSVLADKSGDVYEFTSQLFFDDALSDRVFAQEPYASKGKRNMTNARDGIFRQAGGKLMLPVSSAGDGHAGVFALGIDLSDARTGRPDRSGGPGGRGRPPGGP